MYHILQSGGLRLAVINFLLRDAIASYMPRTSYGNVSGWASVCLSVCLSQLVLYQND